MSQLAYSPYVTDFFLLPLLYVGSTVDSNSPGISGFANVPGLAPGTCESCLILDLPSCSLCLCELCKETQQLTASKARFPIFHHNFCSFSFLFHLAQSTIVKTLEIARARVVALLALPSFFVLHALLRRFSACDLAELRAFLGGRCLGRPRFRRATICLA